MDRKNCGGGVSLGVHPLVNKKTNGHQGFRFGPCFFFCDNSEGMVESLRFSEPTTHLPCGIGILRLFVYKKVASIKAKTDQ